jgi:hypothetical protein
MKNPEDLARFHGGPWHRSHLRSVLAPAPQSLLGATMTGMLQPAGVQFASVGAGAEDLAK